MTKNSKWSHGLLFRSDWLRSASVWYFTFIQLQSRQLKEHVWDLFLSSDIRTALEGFENTSYVEPKCSFLVNYGPSFVSSVNPSSKRDTRVCGCENLVRSVAQVCGFWVKECTNRPTGHLPNVLFVWYCVMDLKNSMLKDIWVRFTLKCYKTWPAFTSFILETESDKSGVTVLHMQSCILQRYISCILFVAIQCTKTVTQVQT